MNDELKNLILEFCSSQSVCQNCPLKQFFPGCGRGFHIVYDGTDFELEASRLIIEAYNKLKEAENERTVGLRVRDL